MAPETQRSNVCEVTLAPAFNHWNDMVCIPKALAQLGPEPPVRHHFQPPPCAYGLYLLGRKSRPLLSGVALFVTISGSIFLGGIFGMWTAFYRGLGNVDPQYTEGAIATFQGMTAPHGAFLLTTTLGKLAILGLALQALTLFGTRGIPKWAVGCVVAGSAMFLCFWDLDNWMLLGTTLMTIGFIPAFRNLLSSVASGANSLSRPLIDIPGDRV